MSKRNALFLAGAAVLLAGSTAGAQTSSYYGGTQTNGLFGANTLGGSSSTSAGNSLSSGNSSGANTGTTAAQPNIAMSAQNVASAATANTRQQTVGAFVGADTSDTNNFLSRQNTAAGANTAGSRSGLGGLNGLSQLQGLFNQNQQNFNGQNQAQSMPQIRIALKLGFTPQPVSTTRLQKFETRLTTLPGMRFVGPAEVVMEGRTAVLRGKVASEDDRKLAEALAKMEPDVLKVRNELVVVDSQTSPSDSPPAAAVQ